MGLHEQVSLEKNRIDLDYNLEDCVDGSSTARAGLFWTC